MQTIEKKAIALLEKLFAQNWYSDNDWRIRSFRWCSDRGFDEMPTMRIPQIRQDIINEYQA